MGGLTWNTLVKATSSLSHADLVRLAAYTGVTRASFVLLEVPHDQWLVTHLHTSWKVSEVKLWLLAKYLPTFFTPIPSIPRQRLSLRRRPVSPITFASREEISDDEQLPADDPYLEHADYFGPLTDPDDPILSDRYKFIPRNSLEAPSPYIIPKANKPSSRSEPSSYVLLSYSTGQILEDTIPFGWYATYPHELLELHPYPFLIKLPRSTIFEYCQSYFEGSAWVMRLLDDFGTANKPGDGSGRLGGGIGARPPTRPKGVSCSRCHTDVP